MINDVHYETTVIKESSLVSGMHSLGPLVLPAWASLLTPNPVVIVTRLLGLCTHAHCRPVARYPDCRYYYCRPALTERVLRSTWVCVEFQQTKLQGVGLIAPVTEEQSASEKSGRPGTALPLAGCWLTVWAVPEGPGQEGLPPKPLPGARGLAPALGASHSGPAFAALGPLCVFSV